MLSQFKKKKRKDTAYVTGTFLHLVSVWGGVYHFLSLVKAPQKTTTHISSSSLLTVQVIGWLLSVL